MDKYTVDLDQVLNDFEYSELTDNYGRPSSSNTSQTQTYHHQTAASSVTKHSINNVFHSLNEYLNTSINDTNSNQKEINTINEITTKNNNDKVDNKTREDHESININETATTKSEETDLVDPAASQFNQNAEENTIPPQDLSNINHDVQNSVVPVENIIDLNINEDLPTKNEIIENIIDLNLNEGLLSNNEIVVDNIIDLDDDISPVVSSENNLKDGSVDIEVTEDNSEKTHEAHEDIDINPNVPIIAKEEIDETNETLDPHQDEVITEEIVTTVEATVSKVGFSDISNEELDDNEVQKLLEELDEDEFMSVSPEPFHAEVNLETSETSPHEIKETGDVIADSDLKEIEQSEVEEEQIVSSHCEESHQIEDNIVGVGVSVVNESMSEGASRPKDLPLHNSNNNLEEQDEKQRKINLIGEPGSTPYNNVYVTKTIEKQRQPAAGDSDSECLTSASPTFSDISTESTSTASTASADDQLDQCRNNGSKSQVKLEDEAENQRSEIEVNPQDSDIQEPVENSNNAVTSDSVDPDRTDQTESNLPEASGVVTSFVLDKSWLGREAPLWIPDDDAISCLHCDMKFTLLKRRHHCRACGLVLCSKCCNMRMKLLYLDAEARVCTKCFDILNRDTAVSSESTSPEPGHSPMRPNPNNPLEYCSTVSPLQQVAAGSSSPPAVMVPVGVLKRKGSSKSKANKSVMFCDGIKPGSDLTILDTDFNYNHENEISNTNSTGGSSSNNSGPELVEEDNKENIPATKSINLDLNRNVPKINSETLSFIPSSDNGLPPIVTINKTDISYSDCSNNSKIVEMLKKDVVVFALQPNLYVHVKIINMTCCISKIAWCFATEGLINVGNDEIVYIIEYADDENVIPKDVLVHVNQIYLDALKGSATTEMGISIHNTSNFLDSKNHAGFVYIRPTFQCLENVIKPSDPFLIGVLMHRWETPWAKLFPLRLILRLGAEYRYYPSPIISVRFRESMFVETGHTIINLLADFRNFTYSLPQIRGLIIHMEEKKTTVTIPANRYDQVMKSISNSSDHILAFAGNFSRQADSHLVCIQDTQGNDNNYTTHAINIHNKPRKVTGASFIVFSGALKSSSGLTAKSTIVEDGLMIQVPLEHMSQLRDNLKAMKNHTISCGCLNAAPDETVYINWGENDNNFNLGVTSPIDGLAMSGVPSIRVHNGKDYLSKSGTRLMRWTEVFILQNSDENSKNQDPVDISKISESIAKATSNALVKYLDLLVSNSFYKIAIRTTLHVENVSYSAGSNGVKLTPIYMKSLDNELIPVLHRITSNNLGDAIIVLELIFRILNV